ncbi:MAG: hypothetical protein H0T73_12900, partial [Ardenticatenales bacterium]|nr:hypothetical protein [Ardenticatenales bacterium]
MNYLFLLMFASLPINAIVFLFGGVGYAELLWWFALVTVVLLMLGTLGLLMSTIFKNGGVATAVAYLLCIVVWVILPVSMLFALTIFGLSGDAENACTVGSFIGLLHPAASLMAIVINEDEMNPARLLPATLPLYAALAGFFFLAAEVRLSNLAARPFKVNRLVMMLVPLVIILVALAYFALKLTPEICNGNF